MERGTTSDESAKTTAAADPAFLAGYAAARADLLMLLRRAFVDGPLNDAARAALRRAALRLGIDEGQIDLVIEPLENVGTGPALLFDAMSAEHRAELLRQALEIGAHDPELAARGERLRARLMVLLDLSP